MVTSLSFREKSVLGSLLILAGVSGYYFVQVFGALGTDATAYDLAGPGIGLLVGLVILEIVYHAVIAALAPDEAQEAADERDRLIAARAGRNGGVTLATGAVLLVGHIMGNALLERTEWIAPVLIANLLLLALVVAQVVEYLSQLIYYRRGI